MKAKITRLAEGAALILDETVLQQLGLEDDGEVELSLNGKVMTVVAKPDEERQRRFRQSAGKIIEKHAGLFERLSK